MGAENVQTQCRRYIWTARGAMMEIVYAMQMEAEEKRVGARNGVQSKVA
jgi:hypothetical protein